MRRARRTAGRRSSAESVTLTSWTSVPARGAGRPRWDVVNCADILAPR